MWIDLQARRLEPITWILLSMTSLCMQNKSQAADFLILKKWMLGRHCWLIWNDSNHQQAAAESVKINPSIIMFNNLK